MIQPFKTELVTQIQQLLEKECSEQRVTFEYLLNCLGYHLSEKTIDETEETKEKRKNYRLASSVLALMLKIDFSDQYDIVDNKIGKIGLSGDEVPAQFYTKLQTYLDCKCSKSYTVPVDSIALGLILDGLKLNDLTKGHNLVVDAIKAEKVKGYSIKTGSKGGVIKL